MDDFNLNTLSESKNEWINKLLNLLTYPIYVGIKNIYTEAYKLCIDNDELDKYLMTFQNFLSRIPKWNKDIIVKELERIKTSTNCNYLDDLITCVHIIQLKALTCIRVGQKQKKININIPNSEDFIHKIYINVARKIYTNVYLFEYNVSTLQTQKNTREIELFIRESIVDAIRQTMPIEEILRSYLDETTEEDVEVEEEVIIETKEPNNNDNDSVKNNDKITTDKTSTDKASTEITVTKKNITSDLEPITKTHDNDSDKVKLTVNTDADINPDIVPDLTYDLEQNMTINTNKIESENTVINTSPPIIDMKNETNGSNKLSFNDNDSAISVDGVVEQISAPKTIERLDSIAEETAKKNRLEKDMDDDDDDDVIKIGKPLENSIDLLNDITVLE